MLKLRGNTFWVMTTIDGHRIRKSTGKTEESEAWRVAPQIIADEMSGSQAVVDSGGMSLADGFQKIFKEEWEQMRCYRQRLQYTREIMNILGEDIMLADITGDTLKHLQRSLKSGKGGQGGNIANPSNGTVNQKMVCIVRLLNAAVVEWSVLAAAPRIKKLKVLETEMRGITEQEFSSLIENTNERMHDVWKVLLETGMRQGEFVQLQWSNINFDSQLIHLKSVEGGMSMKNGCDRSVPMTVTCVAIFKRRKAEGLISPFTGISVNIIKDEWNSARNRMKLHDDKGFVPHSLRHTCATRLIDSGVPTASVQKWLGHKSITTTEGYINQSVEGLKQYLDLIEVKLPVTQQDTL